MIYCKFPIVPTLCYAKNLDCFKKIRIRNAYIKNLKLKNIFHFMKRLSNIS